MIESLDVWIGSAAAMYFREFSEKTTENSKGSMRDIVSISYDPKIRGKKNISEFVLEEIDDDVSGFFSKVAVSIIGPTGTSFKEFLSSVISTLEDADSEVMVTLTLPLVSGKDLKAALKGVPYTLHDFSFDGYEEFPEFLVEKFADKGIEATEKQARYIRSKSDLDPDIVGEVFSTLVGLGSATGAITNQMVRNAIASRIGMSSIFDFENAIEDGREGALRFGQRLIEQKQSNSLALQLVAANVNKYRAISLLKCGLSVSEVMEVTSYTKKDGSTYRMSENQLRYLQNNVVRKMSRDSIFGLLRESDKTLVALKGGPGANMGRASIMYSYLVKCADLVSA